jgi:hypothetical protein
MQYTLLGNTGLTVSRLAFGAMTFTAGNRSLGAVSKVGTELAGQLVERALIAELDAATPLPPVYPNFFTDGIAVDPPLAQALSQVNR